MLQATARRLLLAAIVVVIPHPAAHAADAKTPEALQARVQAALDAGNLESAFYAYRSLHNITGREEPTLLAQVARLSLQREMRSAGGWLRLRAAEILAVDGDPGARALLREAALDPELASAHRTKVIEGLAGIEDPAAVEVLIVAAHDRERPMRERLIATDMLLSLGDISGVADLVLATRGGDRDHWRQAIRILGDHKVVAHEVLWNAVDNGPEEIRRLALRALALQEDAEALAILQEMFGDSPKLVIPERSGTDPETGKQGRILYDFRDVMMHLHVGRILLEVGDMRPLDYLEQVVRDSRAPVNPSVIAGMILEHDRDRGIRLLREVLAEDRSAIANVTAAEALAELGETEGVAAVLASGYRRTLKDRGDAYRLVAVKAMARLHLPESEESLLEALADPSGIHRIHAAEGLCLLGSEAGFRVLRQALDGANRVDALEAAAILMDLAQPSGEEKRG